MLENDILSIHPGITMCKDFLQAIGKIIEKEHVITSSTNVAGDDGSPTTSDNQHTAFDSLKSHVKAATFCLIWDDPERGKH